MSRARLRHLVPSNVRLLSATTQLVLLPGNNWTSAETFVSNGSADALNKVTNPDGSIDGLIFDVHKYLDFDNSYVFSCLSCEIYSDAGEFTEGRTLNA